MAQFTSCPWVSLGIVTLDLVIFIIEGIAENKQSIGFPRTASKRHCVGNKPDIRSYSSVVRDPLIKWFSFNISRGGMGGV